MPLASEHLSALARLSTCAVADAIETFQVRLRNVGFADGTVHCCFDDLPPIVGYAATARLRTAIPPMVGSAYVDRTDWWTSVDRIPGPRIVVLEDVDVEPGAGAFIGGRQAHILAALGVVGIVTNGAVRELPQLRAQRLQCFARSIVPSHAYAHVFEFDVPVRIGGLTIAPGDLLHADRHGLLTVPPDIAADIPAAAAKIRASDAPLFALCQSSDFSIDRLRALLATVSAGGPHEAATPDEVPADE